MIRYRIKLLQIVIFLTLLIHFTNQAKKQKTAVVTDIDDYKEFKKLLRTKTNVMVLFLNSPRSAKTTVDVFKETADAMKGQATLVMIDCSASESKKLCKKLKVDADALNILKHYKDGDFNKDYDRSLTVNSMCNFLRDPTGELPWDEAPDAKDIIHLLDAEALSKFLKKDGYKKSLVMFYAPWCGYCKILKPEYVQAAEELKGEAALAAIDVSKSGNAKIRQLYNITGFPTMLYFEKGQLRFPYNGENNQQSIVSFMRDPVAQVLKKEEPKDESWSEDSDVVHLTDKTFDSVLATKSNALVIFYAPWCGHCKNIKPEFEKAASVITRDSINGMLAAVDATKNPEVSARYGVKAYPTLKYFVNGQYQFDASHARKEKQIIEFIKDPKEPPSPPPPEKPWAEEDSPVRHLTETTFKNTLRKFKYTIVMFYAPWCGHCKSTKPEFVKAAEHFADDLQVLFAAVDCTTSADLCQSYGVKGYPTIKYFRYYDKLNKDYTGGRKEENFVRFIDNEKTGNDDYFYTVY